jgi:hypothetical protein
MSAIGTIAARIVSASSSATQAWTADSVSRTVAVAMAGKATSAPSPPNTKGRSRRPSALSSAEITLAPAMLTDL